MLPLVFLLAAAVAGVGIAATQHVAVQGLAGAAARTAVLDDDDAVRSTVAAGGGPQASVTIAPSDRRRGDLVTVTVSLRHHLFGWPTVAYDVTAVAVARTELP